MNADIRDEIDDRIELAEDDGHEISEKGALLDLIDCINWGYRPKALMRHARQAAIDEGWVEDVTDIYHLKITTGGGISKWGFRQNGRVWEWN